MAEDKTSFSGRKSPLTVYSSSSTHRASKRYVPAAPSRLGTPQFARSSDDCISHLINETSTPSFSVYNGTNCRLTFFCYPSKKLTRILFDLCTWLPSSETSCTVSASPYSPSTPSTAHKNGDLPLSQQSCQWSRSLVYDPSKFDAAAPRPVWSTIFHPGSLVRTRIA